MSKLTITLSLTDDEAEALCALLARGLTQTTYNATLAHHGARIQEYVDRRVDDARIQRGRKIVKGTK